MRRPFPVVLLVASAACLLADRMPLTTPFLSGDSLTTRVIREYAVGVYEGTRHAGWNSLLQMGYPFHAESEGGLFYPPQIVLYALLPFDVAYTATAFVHIIAMALFALLYFRAIGISPAGSAFASLAWTGCGFFMRHFGHEWSYRTAAWLPLALFLAHRMLMDGKTACGPFLALVVGCQWLSGHFNLAYWTLLALALYATLSLAVKEGPPRAVRLRTDGMLATAVALGLALAAIQILPTRELARISHRAEGTGLASFASFSLFPTAPTRFALPDAGKDFPGMATAGETDPYVGILPLFLAIAGLSTSGFPNRKLLLGMLAVSFLLVLGFFFPPNLLLYEGLPGYASLRGPVRGLVLLSLFLCAFAGIGFDMLRAYSDAAARRAGRRSLTAFSALVLVALALGCFARPLSAATETLLAAATLAGFSHNPLIHAQNLRAYLEGLRTDLSALAVWLPVLWAAFAWWWIRWGRGGTRGVLIALALLLLDQMSYARSIGSHGIRGRPWPERFSAEISFLKDDPEPHRIFCWPLMTPPFVEGISFPGTYFFQHYGIANVASTTPRLAVSASIPILWRDRTYRHTPGELYDNVDLLGALGTKYILTNGTLDDPRLEEVFRNRLRIYRNRSFLGRVYLVEDRDGLRPLRDKGTVRILLEQDGELLLSARSAEPATLVLADNPYPAWHADLDGIQVPIRSRPDGFCRLVDLPAGEHRIRFHYASRADRTGLVVTLMAALGILVWSGMVIFKRTDGRACASSSRGYAQGPSVRTSFPRDPGIWGS